MVEYINKYDALEIVTRTCGDYAAAFSEIRKLPGVSEAEIDRVNELAEADKEGRVVVLPCKIGDAVYRIWDDCDFPGDCHTKMKCAGCNYRDVFAVQQTFCLSMLDGFGKIAPSYYLSREEAERAVEAKLNK